MILGRRRHDIRNVTDSPKKSVVHNAKAESPKGAPGKPQVHFVPARNRVGTGKPASDQLTQAVEQLCGLMKQFLQQDKDDNKLRREVICYRCRKPGHIAAKCPDKQEKVRSLLEQEENSDEDSQLN